MTTTKDPLHQKLTKRVLDVLTSGPDRYEIHDTETKGFMLRVNPNGRKLFYCYYRINGVRRRPMIGEYPRLTVEKARDEAKRYLSEATLGRDLSLERQDLRASDTFETFAEMYMKDAAKRVRGRTLEENQRRIDLHLIPALGPKKLTTITKSDMTRLHHRLAEKRPLQVTDGAGNVKQSKTKTTGGHINANRCLMLLRAMFNTAERWGVVPEGSNPCRHVELFKEKPRERYLNPEEFKRLAEALAWAEKGNHATPWAIAALRLLIMTGCRLREILDLRWEYVDAGSKCLRLPESKTGAKVIHLNAPALEVLTTLYQLRGKSPWVIQGHVRGQQLINLTKPWYRIRAQAGLPDLRIHDLRHCFAGVGASLGLGLPIVGKLLGHTQGRTTERYANLAPDPVQAAAEKIGNALVDMMSGKTKVVELRPRNEENGAVEDVDAEKQA